MKENENICYSVMERQDIEGALSVVVRSFIHYEPMTVTIEMKEIDLSNFLLDLMDATTDQMLSVIAKDPVTKEIVGALLAYDFFSFQDKFPVQAPKSFEPIGCFLEILEKMYRKKVENIPNTSIHLFILSVAKEYNGRRIAQNLVDHCIKNAQSRCYKTIFAEATNHASQHILKKSDFKNIFSIYYKDYLYKNGYVFSRIKNEEATKLMEHCLKRI
jgi:ribosomal protein S18 acetylase RimI-like enzyme